MMRSKATQINIKLLVAGFATAFSLGLGGYSFAQNENSSDKNIFVAKPYLQMGTSIQSANHDSQEIMWLAKDKKSAWTVEITEIKESKTNNIVKAKATVDAIAIKEVGSSDGTPDYSFQCKIDQLPLNAIYKYRVLKAGKPVFEAVAHTRKSFDSPLNFVVFGDLAAKTKGQKKIAYQCYLAKPDFVVLPGDIVYNKGLYSEYLDKFFPVYNTDSASADSGVPLIRSVLTIGVLGNHDIALDRTRYTDFKNNPDALAYYFLWSQPLNGPTGVVTSSATPIGGDADREAAFKKAAGSRFPVMGNFSFNYGNTHWLVLDGNYYSNWSDPKMRKFVNDDLANAKSSTWKFVTFHQPPFSIDKQHADEQHMRLLADIFEKEKVDIVFAGHAHDYQRTYPLTFVAKGASANNGVGGVVNPNGTVDGEITVEKTFDGKANKHPHAPIYIVTGGGGAQLYPTKDLSADSVQFMDKVYAAKHSLTKCVINDKKLVFHQISEDGAELDKFEIDK